VVRVSGPAARAAWRALTGSGLPPPRRAVLRRLKDQRGAVLDSALGFFFAGPHSATGEDVVEFHLHGGRAIAESVLQALARVPGLRTAERGEFTRRAVMAGKLDLTQAEALADLIDAETEAQRTQALRQYDGALGATYEGWRHDLIRILAWAEAAIDFPDEDLPDDLDTQLRAPMDMLRQAMQAHLEDSRAGEIVREGIFVTILGAPNAGKSSLVNALARRDVAIVSDIAGTTRDVVEVRLDLGGQLVHLADTAGLRQSRDAIEAEGVRRALARAEHGDMTLLVLDGSAADPYAGLDANVIARATLQVWNKADLAWPHTREGIRLSAKTGDGVAALVEALIEQVQHRVAQKRQDAPMTRARHREGVTEALASLTRALETGAPELLAEDLRLALRALGRLTGRVDVEDLLDVIFRDFCIGK
jgi:tRNA modification GTPase